MNLLNRDDKGNSKQKTTQRTTQQLTSSVTLTSVGRDALDVPGKRATLPVIQEGRSGVVGTAAIIMEDWVRSTSSFDAG